MSSKEFQDALAPLSPRRQKFVMETVEGAGKVSQIDAAIRAGYSEKTAGSTAHKLRYNSKVMAAIQAGFDHKADIAGWTKDKLIAELYKAAQGAGEAEQWGPKVQALTQIGRMLDYFPRHTQISIGGIDSWAVEKLAARILELKERVVIDVDAIKMAESIAGNGGQKVIEGQAVIITQDTDKEDE